jgi:hypothetical protein
MTKGGDKHVMDGFVLHLLRLLRINAGDVEALGKFLEPVCPAEKLPVRADRIRELLLRVLAVELIDVRVDVEIEVLVVGEMVAQPRRETRHSVTYRTKVGGCWDRLP